MGSSPTDKHVVAELARNYASLRVDCERFLTYLIPLIRSIVDEAGIHVHAIESRVKTVESLTEKVARPGKEYTDPLRDIPDIIGIRIIVYYLSDVPLVHDLLESNFAVRKEHSSNKAAELKPDQFGYLSDHLVLTLSDPRGTLPEWKRYCRLHFEVQIRTVLQHAWAAISHSLQYKREQDVPSALRRELFRLSALLETADTSFESLRQRVGELTKLTKEQLDSGRQDVEVNAQSLRLFLAASTEPSKVFADAKAAGFSHIDEGEPWDHEPAESADATISSIAAMCDILGIKTIGAFESYLSASRSWRGDYFAALLEKDHGWYIDEPFALLLLLVPAGSTRLSVETLTDGFEFGPTSAARVIRAASSFEKQAASGTPKPG